MRRGGTIWLSGDRLNSVWETMHAWLEGALASGDQLYSLWEHASCFSGVGIDSCHSEPGIGPAPSLHRNSTECTNDDTAMGFGAGQLSEERSKNVDLIQ